MAAIAFVLLPDGRSVAVEVNVYDDASALKEQIHTVSVSECVNRGPALARRHFCATPRDPATATLSASLCHRASKYVISALYSMVTN